MAITRYNLLGRNLQETFLLQGLLLQSIVGLDVEIGPFDDRILKRVYIWLRGEEKDVEKVLSRLLHLAKEKSIEYISTEIKKR